MVSLQENLHVHKAYFLLKGIQKNVMASDQAIISQVSELTDIVDLWVLKKAIERLYKCWEIERGMFMLSDGFPLRRIHICLWCCDTRRTFHNSSLGSVLLSVVSGVGVPGLPAYCVTFSQSLNPIVPSQFHHLLNGTALRIAWINIVMLNED